MSVAWRFAAWAEGRGGHVTRYACLAVLVAIGLTVVAGAVPYPTSTTWAFTLPRDPGLSALYGNNSTACGYIEFYTNDSLQATFSTGDANVTYTVYLDMVSKFYNATPVIDFVVAHNGSQPIHVSMTPSPGVYLICWQASSPVPQAMNISFTHDYVTDLSDWTWW